MEDKSKPVLVTGASGFLGSHLVRKLVERGRPVRAMLRKSSSKEAMKGLDCEIVYGDALDPISLEAAMQGCGSVFHNVVDVRVYLSDPAPMYRNNLEGAVNAAEAAIKSGVSRFIFTSTMGTLGLNPKGLVNEETPFNWPHVPHYIRARKQAEERILELVETKRLPAIVMCVANTYGPGDYQPTPHNGQIAHIVHGRQKSFVNCGQPTVDIRDAAEALLQAEELGRVGQRYAIANEYITGDQFVSMVATRAGVSAPKLASYRMVWAMAWLSEKWAGLRGIRDHQFIPDAMFLANTFGPIDNTKARTELRWNPRPVQETFNDAVDWFLAHEAAKGNTFRAD